MWLTMFDRTPSVSAPLSKLEEAVKLHTDCAAACRRQRPELARLAEYEDALAEEYRQALATLRGKLQDQTP